MAEEIVQIIKIGTDEAVKSVNDLKENVKVLKERLGDLEIGTAEYQDTLDELKVNQNAVKDAMYATTASMSDLAESATGTSNSYNSLVHRMAALKEELRATDVSTAKGQQRFKELAGQINEVNNSLKDMDALQGNFQRNVGNYPGLLKSWSGSLDALDKGIKATSGDLGKMKNGFDALSVNPAFAVIGVVASLFATLADNLKENEETMIAVNKAGMSLEPLFKFFKGILEKLAPIVADLIGKVTEFVTSNGLISKLTNGIAGVGNAIIKFVVSPFKAVIAAIKVFKEEGVKGLGDAAKAFAQEMKTGVSFKSNYQAGTAAVDGIIAGVKAKKEDAKKEVSKVGKEIGQTLGDSLWKAYEKALAEGNKKIDAEIKERERVQKELDDMTNQSLAETTAEINDYFAEQERLRAQDLKDAEEKQKAKIALMYEVADTTSSILGSIADMYEADEESSARNANKIKALRIASATIDTISGAVGAYMQAVQTIPPPMGQITGAIQAAAVTAAGVAQIAKMKSTKIGGSVGGDGSSIPAIVSAPTTDRGIQQVRNVTSASEEQRLNQMSSDQRVVLVMSDLEIRQNQSRVQVAEASF